MTETPELSSVEERLGAEFWVQPSSALKEEYNFIYANALAEFRTAVRDRGGSVFDYILAERLAFNYAILRQREADQEQELTDRTRRELNKDLIEFTLALKKIWNSEDRVDQAEAVLKKVDKAVWEAIKELPADVGEQLQKRLAKTYAEVGL